MINYIVYIVIALILIYVLIIALRAVNTGLKAKNNYIIGEGTFFSSTMKTKDEENTTAIKGDASAGMYHDMTLKIDQTVSSFTSSFSQNF